MTLIPSGHILLLLISTAVLLGWTHRTLRGMRLTRGTALILLAVMFAGAFLPDISIGPAARLGIGGALVPLGVVVYLLVTADQAFEKRRAILAAIITGGVVFAFDTLLPPEPGEGGLLGAFDPLWVPALAAGFFGYIAGRSRRAAFIAGTLGVVLVDLYVSALNALRGIPGAFANIGTAGVFDAVVLAGVLAVLFAEVIGEGRELLARRLSIRRGRSAPAAAGAGLIPRTIAPPWDLAVTLTLTALLLAGSTVWGDRLWGAPHDPGAAGDNFFQLFDERGRLVTARGHAMRVGDQYIDSVNLFYEIKRVEGRHAFAHTLGTIDLAADDGTAPQPVTAQTERPPGILEWLGRILNFNRRQDDGGRSRDDFAGPAPKILIIHTHNAESYVMSDGAAFVVSKGGVHSVGAELTRQLDRRGFDVIHDEAIHLPHDRGAYRRSRRTLADHLTDNPLLVIDIHRDALPAEFYAHHIDGEGVTRLRLVIGRQNPNFQQNLTAAKEIKAVTDELFPGLFKGIFIARGNYNQDLGHRVLLFEMGAHTNARESAERSTEYVAEELDQWVRQRILTPQDPH
ncbi:MAG: stage II sporulation protein P [Thermaerobacterales bacterium]